jgi:hypothetical protein
MVIKNYKDTLANLERIKSFENPFLKHKMRLQKSFLKKMPCVEK